MKKFCLKFIAFLLIIYFTQPIITNFLKPKMPPHIKTFKEELQNKDTRIVCLGDSSLYYYSYQENIKDSTYYIFYHHFLQKPNIGIMGGAFHMELFEDYFRYICQNKPSIQMVIIPINLRSFSPSWDKEPTYQFTEESALLKDKSNFISTFFKPLSVFKFFDPDITTEEYKSSPIIVDGKKIGEVEDFSENHQQIFDVDFVTKRFKLHYMPDLDRNHKKLVAARKIIRLGKKYNIQPIFFITPVDFQNGIKYAGNQFEKQIHHNVEIIKDVFNQEDEALLDLSTSLDSSYFFWNTDNINNFEPHEHLFYKGRLFVAQQLYNFIKTHFNDLAN